MFERIKKFTNAVKENKVLKESTASVQDQLNSLVQGFEYFGLNYKYAQDVFTEKTYTLHEEKAKCKKAYKDNSYIQMGVNYLLNIIMGDDPKIVSKNESLTLYAARWMFFSGYLKEVKAAIKEAIITGDGYVQKIKGDKGSFKYINIDNSEDMYIEFDYKNNRVKRYIQRVYYTEANAKKINLDTFTISTPRGVETINGIEYNPDEIIHFKFMDNIWGVYGRSPIASVLNDVRIIDQMERALSVIARYKAIPKKIIMPDTTSEDEVLGDKEVAKIKNVLTNLVDFESPVIGTKLTAINLTDGGQSFDMKPYLDYFKQKISVILTPQFIANGEIVNRATSQEEKQIYFLSISGIRKEFLPTIEETSREGIVASLKVLEEEGVKTPKARFVFVFGRYDVELRVEKTERMQKEWNDGMITLDEYRIENDYISDDEFGTLYKWETDAGAGSVDEAIERVIDSKKKD